MDGFSEIRQELDKRNIAVVAASSDAQDKAAEMAAKIGFPVGYGVDQALIESVGGYWEAERNFAQPAEFLLTPVNRIVQLSYSDGPLARTEAGDVIRLVDRFIETGRWPGA